MGLIIGISIAAGALFLGYLYLKHRASQPQGAQGPGGGLFDKAESFIGMGNSLAHNITSTGEQIAKGAIGITDESVNASASVLSGIVNTGGNILNKGASLGKQLASTGATYAVKGIEAPFAAVAPVANGVKDAGKAVAGAAEKVGSSVKSVVSTIGSWF